MIIYITLLLHDHSFYNVLVMPVAPSEESLCPTLQGAFFKLGPQTPHRTVKHFL